MDLWKEASTWAVNPDGYRANSYSATDIQNPRPNARFAPNLGHPNLRQCLNVDASDDPTGGRDSEARSLSS